jgi:hypothetical protein
MNTIANGTNNQNPKDERNNHWDLRIAMLILLFILTSHITFCNHEYSNAKIEELTAELKAQKNDIEVIARYQTNLTPTIVGIVNILSNQTQSIKDLKNIAEIQMMSASDPYSIPATNVIDINDNGLEGK